MNVLVGQVLSEYLVENIGSIFRESVGGLRNPFWVPGGIFADEMWDWDSFWISKAILNSPQLVEPDLFEKSLLTAEGTWRNFFDFQGSDGAVPIMIKADYGDFFGCTVSNGKEVNHAKPIFGQFALDISRAKGEFQWLKGHFDGLLAFYACWKRRYFSASGLYVWGSDVAIGVDCDPATYGRPEFSSANLLLNCLFYKDLLASATIAKNLGRFDDAEDLNRQSRNLAEAILRECWDDYDGFFYSVDTACGDHRDFYLPGLNKGMDMSWNTLPLKVKMFTGFLPLWCGLATPEQARILVESHLRNESEFCAKWGIRSLAKCERMYAPGVNSANPSNWLGPIWILANYMIWEGLQSYGYHPDAQRIAQSTIELLESDLVTTGTLHECYHPDSGEPNFNKDFLSWNLLALLMIGKEV